MTTVAFTPATASRVGRSMAQQVGRVNDPDHARDQLKLNCGMYPGRAADLILALQAEVAQLKADLTAAQAGAVANAPRWCTPAEAARHFGKHISTINRALWDERLTGTQGANGQWRVALPLPTALPTRRRGRKRKTS